MCRLQGDPLVSRRNFCVYSIRLFLIELCREPLQCSLCAAQQAGEILFRAST